MNKRMNENIIEKIPKKEEVLLQIENVLNVQFSEEQKAAVYHFGKPLNILSCAGSGKTTTLIGKMLFMEMYYNVPAVKILAITFNKEAIDEMENRYFNARKKLGLSRKDRVTFKTYHSLYYLILNSKYSEYSWKELGDFKKYTFVLKEACKKAFKKFDDDTLENVMSLRGYQVNNMLTNEELMKIPKFLTSGLDPNGYMEVVDKFEELKARDNRIDFDDLQTMMYKAIKENPELLNIIHKAWDYIVVDEYQDISKVQLEILKDMVKDKNKLTAIGDDDQSIYEFRGSKTEYIVDFKIHFIGADRIVMGTNYRCPENILIPITKSISNNKKRVKKDMKAFREDGELKYVMSKGIYDSAVFISEEISKFKEEEKNLDEIVILIRNNSQQRIILDALLEKDIPVSTKSDYKLSNHFIVNDLRDVVELAINEKDYVSFKKVFSKIAKYVKRSVVNEISDKMKADDSSWREHLISYDNPTIHEASSVLYSVKALIDNEKTFSEIVEKIQPLYREYLKFMVNKYDYDADEIGDILKYVKFSSVEKTYDKFYKDLKRKESLKRYFEDQDDNTVKISTMHKMKGLEYSTVYLLDLTESILPNAKIEFDIKENYGEKFAEEYIEEERRLFYVAWTRAKDYLCVMVNNDYPSRFILETIQHK
jgi:DNA helicase-2/ATP-dependent DNA helicase PcrA